MRRSTWGIGVFLLVACGGGGAAPDAGGGDDGFVGPGTAHVPELATLQPGQVAARADGFVLEADGVDFADDAIVVLDGAELTTRVLSASGLEADVPTGSIAVPGRRWLQVINPGDSGGASNALPLDVVDGIAMPVLDSLLPDRVVAGSPGFTLTVRGWNFTPDSVVSWNGSARPTTFVSSVALTIAIDTADVATAGSIEVVVTTPGVDPSAPLTFTVGVASGGTIGVIERVSVSDTGAEISDGFDPVLSADGRYVVFGSNASDVITGDGCCEDLFERDTCRGATGCTPSVTRVSVSSTGGDPNGYARHAAISGNGRYVAFSSSATNLVPGSGSGQRVFVRDTCAGATGCTPTTLEASLRADGGEPSLGDAALAAISADGRYVAFESSSPDIVAGDTSTPDVYLRDTCAGATGCTPSTIRISESAAGVGGSGPSTSAGVSGDGRYVAFQSVATNLDGQAATMFRGHAYVRDTCAGATGCTPSVIRADVAGDGSESNSSVPEQRVAISANGRFVAFSSSATNLTADTVSNYQVFVRDTCLGATGCTPATELASGNATGGSNDDAWGPQLSGDGRYVVFETRASDLVAGDTNNRYDVFARDLCHGAAGCVAETRRVSIGPSEVEGNGHSGQSSQYVPARVSDDGALIAFASIATNLVLGDGNAATDAFLAATGFTP